MMNQTSNVGCKRESFQKRHADLYRLAFDAGTRRIDAPYLVATIAGLIVSSGGWLLSRLGMMWLESSKRLRAHEKLGQ